MKPVSSRYTYQANSYVGDAVCSSPMCRILRDGGFSNVLFFRPQMMVSTNLHQQDGSEPQHPAISELDHCPPGQQPNVKVYDHHTSWNSDRRFAESSTQTVGARPDFMALINGVKSSTQGTST